LYDLTQPVEGLGAVRVHVSDIQRARTFYREVPGLDEAGFTEPTGRYVYSFPATDVDLAIHVQRPGEGGREPGTVSGVNLRLHDPRASVEEIRRRGGTTTLAPVDVPGWGGTHVRAVVADPRGNEFVPSTVRPSAPKP
jgi:predicted enzyme related to lactoylglutathione lyase